jgi:hypothetical protein
MSGSAGQSSSGSLLLFQQLGQPLSLTLASSAKFDTGTK